MKDIMVRTSPHAKQISEGMVYGAQLDRYVWAVQEKWALRGFAAGAFFCNLVWMIILSF